MKKVILALVFIFNLNSVYAGGGGAEHLIERHWAFDGKFGQVDKQSAQRGFQVYKEVCAACHSLKRVYFRNLEDIGFSAEEVKALAAEYTIIDGPDEAGDMYERPAKPSDQIPGPYANENAARASNGGAFPPDLSLMVKARPNGANYLYSLLNGYRTPPKHVKLSAGMAYNIYFPGKQIAMPVPLAEGQVEYMDGTPATMEQMSVDLVNFLQWTAEPEMEYRNKMGIRSLMFLVIFTILFVIAKRRVWKNVK